MRQCSYCGRENEETAKACSGCGTEIGSTTEQVKEAESGEPTEAMVIVRTFETLERASVLAGRLRAAGIEAWIPESGTQPYSNVIPFSYVTVRVVGKDSEEAEAIAAELGEAGPETVGLARGQRAGLTCRGMSAITAVIVLAAIMSGVVTHSIRESLAMGPAFWLWAVLSVGCLWWGRYAFRRHRSLGWGCLAIDLLQIVSFMLLFWTIDFPENARIHPHKFNSNPHVWG